MRRAIAPPDPFLSIGIANQKEEIMKITSLIVILVAAGALTAIAQEGAVEDVKQGAKKAGQKIKQGVETAAEKTKETAETVGEKTKETAETVGKKTKEAVTGEKTETARTTHGKAKKASKHTNEQTITQQSNREGNTPIPTPSGR